MSEVMDIDKQAPTTPPPTNEIGGLATATAPKTPTAPQKAPQALMFSSTSTVRAGSEPVEGSPSPRTTENSPTRVGQHLQCVKVPMRSERSTTPKSVDDAKSDAGKGKDASLFGGPNAPSKAQVTSKDKNADSAGQDKAKSKDKAKKTGKANVKDNTKETDLATGPEEPMFVPDNEGDKTTGKHKDKETIVVRDEAEKSTAKGKGKLTAKNPGPAKAARLANMVRGTSQVGFSRTGFNLHVTGTPGGMDVESGKRGGLSESAFSTWHMYQDYQAISKTDESTWPPMNVVLQDWHIWKILEAGIPGKARGQRWKADFGTVGILRGGRTPRGRPAKQAADDGKLHYVVVWSFYQLQGDEGGDMPYHKGDGWDKGVGNKTALSDGDVCRIQDDFVPTKAELTHGIYEARYPAGEAPSDKKKAKSRAGGAKRKNPDSAGQASTPAKKKGRAEELKTAGKKRTPKQATSPASSSTSARASTVAASQMASPSNSASLPTISPIVFNSRRIAAQRAQDAQATAEATQFYARELGTFVVNTHLVGDFTQAALDNIRDGIYAAAQADEEDDANDLLTHTVSYIQAVSADLRERGRNSIRSMVSRGQDTNVTGVEALRRAINTNYARPAFASGVRQRLDLPPMHDQLNFSINAAPPNVAGSPASDETTVNADQTEAGSDEDGSDDGEEEEDKNEGNEDNGDEDGKEGDGSGESSEKPLTNGVPAEE